MCGQHEIKLDLYADRDDQGRVRLFGQVRLWDELEAGGLFPGHHVEELVAVDGWSISELGTFLIGYRQRCDRL